MTPSGDTIRRIADTLAEDGRLWYGDSGAAVMEDGHIMVPLDAWLRAIALVEDRHPSDEFKAGAQAAINMLRVMKYPHEARTLERRLIEGSET